MMRSIEVGSLAVALLLACGARAADYRNGLSDADRKVFYHLAEGSEVYPLDWLRVLESKQTGKLFLDNMERFGFLPDPGNADGLPVGLAAAKTRGLELVGRMVGLNCAACHVGQLTYKGTSVRIDGAPNLLDARLFFADLVGSAVATAEDPEKLLAFLARLQKSRTAQPDATAPQKAAGKLIVHLGSKEVTNLKPELVAGIKKLVAQARKAPLTNPGQMLLKGLSGAEVRKRLLQDLKPEDLKALLDDKLLAGSPLAALAAPADREAAVRQTAEDLWVAVRLLQARMQFLSRLARIGQAKLTDWGPGRVDAFGSVRALYFDDKYLPNAPVHYPRLWQFSSNPYFHYDNNTTSILERNLGQALGVGAIFEPDTFASTLRPADANTLEELAWKITVPAWPEAFGKVDKTRAGRGQVLFKKHCADCHAVLKDGEPAPDRLYELKDIGTDPGRAQSFAATLPDGKTYVDALAVVLDKVTKRSFVDNKITPEQQKQFAHGRVVKWRAPNKYAARPMAAAWASPPYLHNGSVPTLYDLLLPAAQRPKKFPLGQRDYDPKKLGYVTDVAKPRSTFDTSLPGNSNAGHEYGTKLSDDERYDLLEYLKGN
jgi:hypothetical protein